jgi:MFS family permease
VVGSITIKGEKLYLLHGMREILPSGARKRLDPAALHVGDTVGVYTEELTGADESLAFCYYVVRSPKPQSARGAALTLDQQHRRTQIAGMLLFPLVAGFIGLFIGAADGIVCRLPRRALLCGFVGLLVGLVGGFVCSMAANVAYGPLTHLAMKQSSDSSSGLSTFGFVIQMFGRSLAWGLAGVAMGLGQGIALRSKRLLIYGLIGGIVGGLLGGILFDPINLILLGADQPSALSSRLIGLAVIGAGVGAMIGIVELLARDAWLRMTQGPLTGKEFLLFKDIMKVGSSPRSDIYLFNDPLVTGDHAVIRAVGDECEIEARETASPVLLNSRTITRARLRHGDTVTIGRTMFVFQRRRG